MLLFNICSCIPESEDFHSQAKESNQPFHFASLTMDKEDRLLCPPVTIFSMFQKNINNPFEVPQRIMIRGDSHGRVGIWSIPDFTAEQLSSVAANPDTVITKTEDNIYSLNKSWETLRPLPGGIFDQFITEDRPRIKITASVYLPFQGRLVCGREDGSIIIISATYTVMAHLLSYRRRGKPGGNFDDIWSQHQILEGHSGRVNCLLYPHHSHERYDIAYLLSGGVDFSVCLWDIYAGTLLHRFSVHAGEITQICVPPKDCSPRILQSVCSIASDHSVAILSLKERKCIMSASRHLFPIQVIKWRPLDDFMIVGCSDGSVYVWQMETGHLDRVVQGINAEEILAACDEHAISTSGDKLTNPALHLLRGLRHRNLAAIRHAAARGLTQFAGQQEEAKDVVDTSIQQRSHPLMIQGLKANPKDQNCHVLFFDLESMIVNLLSEEYALLSPNTLESQGLTANTEYHKFLTMSCSPEGHNKLSGMFNKMKESAGTAAQKIQSKAERVGFKPGAAEGVSFMRKASTASEATASGTPTKTAGKVQFGETKLTMEIAQLILSLLHAWGLDDDLDRVCESKLGLLRPLRPVCFGILAKNGHMSLLLPMRIAKMDDEEESSIEQKKEGKHIRMSVTEVEKALEESRAQRFAARIHWELSTAITTSHLLSIMSLANTLMSMSSATFIAEQERKRRLYRRLSRADSRGEIELCEGLKGLDADSIAQEQQQIKQGWSLLAALHCVLLPEHLKSTGKYKKPLVEVLARRWQDRCLEIREAAQALLLAELRRLGSKGRKLLVDEWAPFLPPNTETATMTALTQRSAASQITMVSNPGQNNNSHGISSQAGSGMNSEASSIRESKPSYAGTGDNVSNVGNDSDDDVEDIEDHVSEFGTGSGHEESRRTSTTTFEDRRRQMTAIILLGVIGSEYGHEVEQSKRKVEPQEVLVDRKKSVVEGFGGQGNYSLARHTAHSLAFLLLVKASRALPLHTSHRRAAIDLLGRGFTVWEPYLDVSKVLLALLELCCESEKMVPSMSFGLPLTPSADSCRTAKHSISLIATARPAAFITTLAREVARYNTIQQNPQSMNVNLFNTVLSRAKPEILRNIELLIEKMPNDVGDLIIESMDIILHCLDLNNLKNRTLTEVFPSISKFANVTFCAASKRIAVGSKNGILAIFELKMPQKSQILTAHSNSVTCCAFAPDGKHLATYSMEENKICFWSTATSLFGLGQSQTKCVKTYNTKPVSGPISLQDPVGSKAPPRLIWVANKALILMFADGSECRYSV